MSKGDRVLIVVSTLTFAGAIAIAVRQHAAIKGRSRRRSILSQRLDQVRASSKANEDALRHVSASLDKATQRIERLANRLAELEQRKN